jgi:hypothetical protein
MKSLFIALAFTALAGFAAGFTSCSSSGSVCEDDHCACAAAESCSHDCTPGGLACEVQCSPGEPCSVGCAAGEHCHVECSGTSSCAVDCGSSPECHVTCPATGCTVHNCVGEACVVTCGGFGLPSHSGSTASCP